MVKVVRVAVKQNSDFRVLPSNCGPITQTPTIALSLCINRKLAYLVSETKSLLYSSIIACPLMLQPPPY
jgi:hypothetical protein